LLALACVLGIRRLGFDTDPLGMLPGGLPEVRGMQVFEESFATHGELVVLLDGTAAAEADLREVAEGLGEALVAGGLVREARWQPRWEAHPEGFTELVGYSWLNADPAELAAFAARLRGPAARATLDRSREELAAVLEGSDLALRAHDPFRMLDSAAVKGLLASAGDGGDGFESAAGDAHLLFLAAPGEVRGYAEAGKWLAGVRDASGGWLAANAPGVTLGFTGEPVFAAEIGGAMRKDLSGTVVATSLLIAAIFWWMQRRLSLLFGIVVLLGLVFALTLGAAGWLLGELSIMAVGFAAILIGLAVDYAVIICQEARVDAGGAGGLRRAVRGGIGWGAGTTAAVFLSLMLSSFPGIGQLGVLVALGITIGAVVMLGLFPPVVARIGVRAPGTVPGGSWFPGRRLACWIGGLLALGSVAVIATHGLPHVSFDAALMRPTGSEALATFERIQKEFGAWREDSLQVVIEAPTSEAMRTRLAATGERLEAAQRSGLLAGYHLPSGWWPDEERQRANLPVLVELAGERAQLLGEADAAGFTAEGSALAGEVLDWWAQLTPGRLPAVPRSPAAREILGASLVVNEAGGGAVVGRLDLAGGRAADRDHAALRAVGGEGAYVAGWQMLRPAMLPLVDHDLFRVFLPMGAVMVGMLALVFRSGRDVLLAVAVMVLAGLMLSAGMALAGLEWNFLNIAAIPLLIGTGVDYAIHMILALRRHADEPGKVWEGIGKAVLFCGASTALGFGSLAFASTEALASMGKICAAGILLTMGLAVVLLPGWRGRQPDR
jgi:predicted exporter